MWDWIKETAANAVNAGAQYVIHVSFIESLLNMTYEQAYDALRQKIYELDDQGFEAFWGALNTLYMQTEQQLNSTDQYGSGESWGASFEDRMAQSMAEIQAGVTHQPNPAYQQLQYRLQNLQAVAQHAQAFRQEATDAAAIPGPTSPEEAAAQVPDNEPSQVARGVNAFEEHARRIQELFASAAPDATPADDTDSPLDEMAALQLYIATDGRVTSVMTRLLPGQADESVVEELMDICGDYNRILNGPPSSHGMYSDADLHRKIGQSLSFAGMASESLRNDERALTFYEQACQAYDTAGDQAEATKCRGKIDELKIVCEGDVDADIERLQQAVLEMPGPTLARVDALIGLGEALTRQGDSYGARDHLLEAEAILTDPANGFGEPGSDDLAQSLLSSMQALMDGDAQAGGTEIESKMALRGLYGRLYHALAAAYRDDDPDKASGYLDLAEDMDSDAQSQDFGKEMMALLGGKYQDLLK